MCFLLNGIAIFARSTLSFSLHFRLFSHRETEKNMQKGTNNRRSEEEQERNRNEKSNKSVDDDDDDDKEETK